MPRPSREVVYNRLERAVSDLEESGGLPTLDEAKSIWEGIWHEEAHHSTAIEGNTLGTREVQLLLFEGRAVGSKELREYLEVQGYADAALWVYGQAVKGHAGLADLTVAEVREIHRRVVSPVWQLFPPPHLDRRDSPGQYRHTNIEALRPGLVPPDWPLLPPLVTDWVAAVNGVIERETRVIEDLAELHAAFERIHPFNDGNGRVGRLLLNLLLVRYGYPPAVIHKKDRGAYLTALWRADDHDPGLLGELIARSVKYGIDRFLIPRLAGTYRFVPIASLTDMGFTHNALVLAAKRGRLEATQKDGQWYSSRKAVEDYIKSRYRRTPKGTTAT